MNAWAIVIIVVCLGFIVGNIMLLKHSAKMRLPTPKHNNNKNWDDKDD